MEIEEREGRVHDWWGRRWRMAFGFSWRVVSRY